MDSTEDPDRQTGRSFNQMVGAPQGAYFVHFGATGYYQQLAIEAGRTDLKLHDYMKGFTAEDPRNYRRAMVLDHYVREKMDPRDVAWVDAFNRRFEKTGGEM